MIMAVPLGAGCIALPHRGGRRQGAEPRLDPGDVPHQHLRQQPDPRCRRCGRRRPATPRATCSTSPTRPTPPIPAVAEYIAYMAEHRQGRHRRPPPAPAGRPVRSPWRSSTRRSRRPRVSPVPRSSTLPATSTYTPSLAREGVVDRMNGEEDPFLAESLQRHPVRRRHGDVHRRRRADHRVRDLS